MNAGILSGYKVGKSEVTYRYWNIKNTEEMEEYIREVCPEIVYNEAMMGLLVKYEFQKLLEIKMKGLKVQEEPSKIEEIIEEAKDIQYSA